MIEGFDEPVITGSTGESNVFIRSSRRRSTLPPWIISWRQLRV